MNETIINPPEKKIFFDAQTELSEFARYTDLTQIGEGGISRVYKAYDNKLSRFVALKILKKGISSNKTALQRFKQEITFQANLNIPGCTKIFDCGEEKGQVYCVMEYIEGKSLDLIILENRLSVKEKINILFQITKIIKDIHSHGLEHRDIKPANIIIDNNDKIHILDFGLAKAVNDKKNIYQTVYGEFFGTPAYMSPEQADTVTDSKVNFKSDIYSLGITAYQFLSNHLPYDLELLDKNEIIYIIKNEIPKSLKQFNRNIPDKLEKLILKTLEKKPSDRPGINEFYNSLKKIAGKHSKSKRFKFLYLLTALIIMSFTAVYILIYQTSPTSAEKTQDINPKRILPKDISEVKNSRQISLSGLSTGSYEAHLKQKQEAEKLNLPIEISTSKFNIKMRLIPAGISYKPASDKNSKLAELKINKPYYMGIFEISEKQWNTVMNINPENKIEKPDMPVIKVSWTDCMEFLNRLCKELEVPENTYRLPTVEEWEYAAAGGTSTPFYFGFEVTPSEANFLNNSSANISTAKRKPSESFPPNGFGIYDTIGNTSEWCSNEKTLFPNSQEIINGIESINLKAVKGGSWLDDKAHCKVSHTDFIDESIKNSILGFRIVRNIPE